MGNYFSYMRISTKEERGKQKFSRQEVALEKYAKENGIKFTLEFKEDISGKNFEDRVEWNKLEAILQSGDTIVFKDVSRFTREALNGESKYMSLLSRGVDLIFIDNQTISTPYIKKLLEVAEAQSLVAKISLESTVRLLLIVELDRVEQERLTLIKRTKDGMAASPKKAGRVPGKLDKMSDALENDIRKYLSDRSIKQVTLMNRHNISRNTLKKYISIVKENMQDAAADASGDHRTAAESS